MKRKLCFVCTLILVSSVCRAGTVLWDVALITGVPIFGCDNGLYVDANDVTGGNIVGFNIVSQSADSITLAGQNWASAISYGHAWRLLLCGDLVDANSVMGDFDDYFLALFDSHYNDIFSDLTIHTGESVYLGFFIEGDPYLDPLFGWVELSYDGKNAFVVGSAMETTGLGIYAGTGWVVPEPSVALLSIVGLAALCLRRRKGT